MTGNNKKKHHNRKDKNKKNKHDSEIEEPHKNALEESQEELNQSSEEINLHKLSKREHLDDDSDLEDRPKRKKKKKQVVTADTGDKKGKKSIRQMKREKFAQRQAEAQAVAKDQLKSQCITYLSQWKHDRQNWKFMKAKQVWLYKNKFSSQLVPDASWPVFLEYFESAQGNIRNMLLDDAKKIIKQFDDWKESENEAKENSEETEETDAVEISRPDDAVYKRARDLIQCLHE